MDAPPPGLRQDLFILTAIVALPLAAVRLLEVVEVHDRQHIIVVVFVWGATSLVTLLVALTTRGLGRRLLIVASWGVVIVGPMAALIQQLDAPRQFLIAITAIDFATIAGTLWVFRLLGYPLVVARTARGSPPPDKAAVAH